jgi:hypothetical protein
MLHFRQPSPAVRARTRAMIPVAGELGSCRVVLRPLFLAPLPGLAVVWTRLSAGPGKVAKYGCYYCFRFRYLC